MSIVRDRLFPEWPRQRRPGLCPPKLPHLRRGNAVSLIGVWMQRVAVGWLAWTLTHSGTWLGIISMAEFFPVVFSEPARRRARRPARPGRDHPGNTDRRQRRGEPARRPRLYRRDHDRAAVRTDLASRRLQRGGPALAAGADPDPGRSAVVALGAGDQRDHLQLRPVYRAGGRRDRHRQGQRRRRVCRQCRDLCRLSRRDDEFARHPGIAGRRDSERAQGLGRGLCLCQPASRHRADAAAVHGDDDRHPRLCRAVSRFCRQRLRARAGRSGDPDLDGRARRHLRRRLDAAAPGDRWTDRARARQHLDDLAGDPRLYR